MNKKNKKVLILCQYFYPEYVSSATLPTQLAEDLVKNNIDVDVICGWPYEYSNTEHIHSKETYKGIKINRLKYTRFNNKSKIGRLINFFSLFLRFLINMPKMLKYNHIFVYSNPPILPIIPDFLKRIFKIKYTAIIYDIAPDNAIKIGAIKNNSAIKKLMDYVNDRVYHNANNIVVLGNEMKEYIIQQGISRKPENIIVIPNWYESKQINENRIFNKEFKELRNKYDKIILYSGNMGELQDMDTILQYCLSVKEHKNILNIICGHGKKTNLVKEFIEKNSIENTVVFGFVTGSDYTDLLKISDLTITSLIENGVGLGVPSKSYGYLAAGKPIIAIMNESSDIVKELNKYNAGINIKNNDYEMMKEVITNLTNEHIDNMSKNAYQLYLDKYTRKINTTKYLRLLNE